MNTDPRFHLRTSAELHDLARQAADVSKRTLSNLIRYAVEKVSREIIKESQERC